MARIPVPAVGQVGPRIVTNPRAGMIGDALQGLGQTGMQIAGQQLAQQAAEQAQAQREAAAEAKRVAAEERQQREAEARAAAHAAAQTGQGLLAEAHDELSQAIVDGTVPKDEADKVWKARIADITDSALAELPESPLRGRAKLDIERTGTVLSMRLRRAVNQRGRLDVSAGIDQSLEYLGRAYLSDPEGTTLKAMQTVDEMGPHSSYTPKQLAALKQGWRERTQAVAAEKLISTASRSDQLLAAAEKALERDQFADLDPGKRVTLVTQISDLRMRLAQKAAIDADRAARAHEARMRDAERTMNAAMALADLGALSADFAQETQRRLAGTPFAGAFSQAVAAQAQTGPIAAAPLPAVRESIDRLNATIAQKGLTPELQDQRKRLEAVHEGQLGAIQKHGALRAWAERTPGAAVPPLKLSNGSWQEIAATLAQRRAIGEEVSRWTGRPESPLYPEEAEQLGKTVRGFPIESQGVALASIYQALGPGQADALAKQIDKTDRPLALAMAAGIGRTSGARNTFGMQTAPPRATAEIILKGARAIADRAATDEGLSAITVRANIAKRVGDVFRGQAREDVIDTARLIYFGKGVEGSGKDIDAAIGLAVNGSIIEHNGVRIPIGPGLDARSFAKQLENYGPASIAAQAPDGQVLVSGQTMPIAQFLTGLPGARLEPVGEGRYYVRAGGTVVTNSQRKPITIKVQSLGEGR